MTDAKAAAEELMTMATSAAVKFPKIWEATDVKRQCASTMLSIPRTEAGDIDLAAALEALIEQYGSDQPTKKRKAEEDDADDDDEEGEKKKSTKTKKKDTVAVEENRGLAEAIAEISSIYYKNGERMKGGVFSKAAKAIREAETELSTGKEAMKLKGIGKGIGAAIDEYRNSGMIKKLEELRAGTA